MPKRKDTPPGLNWQPVLSSNAEREAMAAISFYYGCDKDSDALRHAVRFTDHMVKLRGEGCEFHYADESGAPVDRGVILPEKAYGSDELLEDGEERVERRWTVMVHRIDRDRRDRICEAYEGASRRDVYRLAVMTVGRICEARSQGLYLWVTDEDQSFRLVLP